MIDFDKIIRAAMDEGASVDDLAKQFSDALNEANKPSPRDEFIETIEKRFNEAIKKQHMSVSDMVDGLTLCIAQEYPKWDVEAIEAFYDATSRSVKDNAKLVDCVATGGSILDTIGSLIGEMVEESAEAKASKKAGSQPHRSDEEKLAMFLRGLGI